MRLIFITFTICTSYIYAQYDGIHYAAYRSDFYNSPQRAPSAWELWNEKLRAIDAKLSAQLIQRTVALRRRVDELQNEIDELRQAETYDWNRSDSGILYKIFMDKRDFDDAEAVCKSFHSRLAVIDTKHKNEYINELLSKAFAGERNDSRNAHKAMGIWIGLRMQKVEMSSDDGNYSNFADEQAIDGCAAMTINGKWQIRNCTEERPFVCQQQLPILSPSDDRTLQFVMKCCRSVGLFDDVYRK